MKKKCVTICRSTYTGMKCPKKMRMERVYKRLPYSQHNSKKRKLKMRLTRMGMKILQGININDDIYMADTGTPHTQHNLQPEDKWKGLRSGSPLAPIIFWWFLGNVFVG
jgi:hypothetical protein